MIGLSLNRILVTLGALSLCVALLDALVSMVRDTNIEIAKMHNALSDLKGQFRRELQAVVQDMKFLRQKQLSDDKTVADLKQIAYDHFSAEWDIWQLQPSAEVQKALHLEPFAFTAMKASKMSQSATFGKMRGGSMNPNSLHSGRSIWISSFERSGSSVVLELVSQALIENRLFSIFEPCAETENEEVNSTEMPFSRCMEYIEDVQSCHFEGVGRIAHWRSMDSSIKGSKSGRLTTATPAVECMNGDLRIFRTTDFQRFESVIDLLEQYQTTKTVQVIRDPRAIWASQLQAVESGVLEKVLEPHELCSIMARNMKFKHPNLVTLKFESLVRRPHTVARKLFEDLDLDFGQKVTQWLSRRFSKNADCQENTLSSCKQDPTKSMFKWRAAMTAEAAEEFRSAECKAVIKYYGYEHCERLLEC